jgi:hypothetical protein
VSAAAFYCVADARYFLGAVGLINSLRLHGHTEPIYLLDCGLTEPQRELLAREVELVRVESETPPWLLKTIAPLAHPAEAMVLIDADMIVTRRLDELFARAREGRVVAFRTSYDRSHPDWGELLGLGPLRTQPYVSSGLVVLAGQPGRELLTRLSELQPVVEPYFHDDRLHAEAGWPFFGLDQDVLNALLASEMAPLEAAALPHRLCPNQPFAGLRAGPVGGPPTAAYENGERPFALHHFGPKPWLERLPGSAYARLLSRCLAGPGLPLEPPGSAIPARLRSGPHGRATRAALALAHGVRHRAMTRFAR